MPLYFPRLSDVLSGFQVPEISKVKGIIRLNAGGMCPEAAHDTSEQ